MKKLIIFLISIGSVMVIFYGFKYKEPFVEEWVHPIVTVQLGNESYFKIELYPEEAPNTVSNFIDLIRVKFYDGLSFTKLIPDYLIQSGDHIGNGTGFPGYFIPSECKENGFDNQLVFEEGIVCMARGAKFNTEGSQFFVLLTKDRYIEGDYTAFGKVIEGIDVLKEIANSGLSTSQRREKGWYIDSMKVETFGQVYEEPKVLSIYEVRDEIGMK